MPANTSDPSGDDPAKGEFDIETIRARSKTGRNATCPCGSGRKYKKCCLLSDQEILRQRSATTGSAPLVDNASEFDDDDFFGDPISVSGAQEEALSAEDKRVEALWDEMLALDKPSAEQLDQLLTELLSLPAEKTDWSELLCFLQDSNYPDLPAAFRRIDSAIPSSRETGKANLYWTAAEIFTCASAPSMLCEIAAGFGDLDASSYDMDALAHILDNLLAEELDAIALDIAERFLPVVRADDELVPSALPRHCELIFELRVGRSLRSDTPVTPGVSALVDAYLDGIEEYIDRDLAERIALLTARPTSTRQLTHADFDMPPQEPGESPDVHPMLALLVEVVQQQRHILDLNPGSALTGLQRVVKSWQRGKASAKSAKRRNLLGCLESAGDGTASYARQRGLNWNQYVRGPHLSSSARASIAYRAVSRARQDWLRRARRRRTSPPCKGSAEDHDRLGPNHPSIWWCSWRIQHHARGW